MAYVYWIKFKGEKSDILTDGYIGYTSKSVKERFKKHASDACGKERRNYKLHNIIRKYGQENLEIVTLVEGEEDYCLFIEEKLRPEKNIGWNHNKGGFKPPAQHGRVMSASHRLAISKAQKGRKRTADEIEHAASINRGRKASPETREKLSARRRGKKPWQHTQAILSNWLEADKLFQIYMNNPAIGKRELSTYLKEGCADGILKHFKTGWNPLEDQHWLEFKASYEESQHDQTK